MRVSVLLLLLFAIGCGNKSDSKTDTETTKTGETEVTKTYSSPKKAHVAFAGGGWRAHTGHAGWMISLLNGKRKLNDAFANVGTISSNSGGSWFNTMMAISPKFVSDIEDGNAINNWSNAGQGWLGTQHELFKNNSKDCGIVEDGPGYTVCVIENYLGSATNWANIVEGMVYQGYSLGPHTLNSGRQPWAADKTLLLASSMLKTNVVMNDDGPGDLSSHYQYYQACQSPSTPGFYSEEFYDRGGTCSGDKPFYEVAPVTFSGKMESSIQSPPFFSSLSGSEQYNLMYSETSITSPTTATATMSNPINTDNVSATHAAAASSAALGFEAYTRIGDITDPWLTAYEARNLAPSFSLKGSTIDFVPDADNLSAQDMANGLLLRLADGGPVDNSGVSQLVAFLQQNYPNDSLNIIAFDNVTASFPPPSSPLDPKAKVGLDIANLFGKGVCDDGKYCIFNCSDFLNFCVEIPELQIFDVNPFLTTTAKWTAQSNNMELIYTKYQILTVENENYGIQGNWPGTLHAFTCVAPNAGTMPLNETFDSYTEMLQFIYSSLTADSGEKLGDLEAALRL